MTWQAIRRCWIGAAVVAVGTLTSPALSRDDLSGLVARLASDDAAVRLAASEELAARGDVSLRDLEALIVDARTPAEARARLVAAARQRFFGSPRAAMGILRGNELVRGVMVESVREEFPASRVLLAGDRIESIEGHRIDSFETFRAHLISRDPGDVVRVGLVRNGQPMMVRVELGMYGGGAGLWTDLDEVTLETAWVVRTSTWPRGEGEAIVVRLAGPSGVSGDEVPTFQEPVQLPDGTFEPFSVTAGGEGSGRVASSWSGGRITRGWAGNRGQIQVQIGGQQPFGVQNQRARLQALINSTERNIAMLRQTIEQNAMMMRQAPGQPAAALRLQRQLEEQIDREQVQLARLRAQLERMDGVPQR